MNTPHQVARHSSHVSFRILVLFVALVIWSGQVEAQKGKPSSSTGGGSCKATFTNTGSEGIVDEGKGTYVDGLDGTRCTVNPTDGSGNSGDLLFTLNFKKGVKTSRSAVLFFDRPVEGSVSRGVWVVGGNFHLKIKGLGDIEVGQTISHRAGFHVPYLGTNYKLRYGWEDGDGTSITHITRTSSSEWVITSLDPQIARLWTGGSFGDGTVYGQMGDYVIPFTLTIVLK